MDETLIHSRFFKLSANEPNEWKEGLVINDEGEPEFNIIISNNPSSPPTMRLNVKVRQHLEEALTYLSNMYEICVFTAGEQDYADAILDIIDVERTIIKHRLYRHHCVKPAPGVFVKELSII